MKKHLGISFSFGLLLIVFCPLSLVNGQGYRPAQERNAYDYFDRVGDKSYYQQQKIDFMKDEMNDYSRRLHSLQEKFNQKFFGSGSGDGFKSPFSKQSNVSPPQNNFPEPEKEDSKQTSPRYLKNSQKLAFEVNQGEATPVVEDEQPKQVREANQDASLPVTRHKQAMGGYLVLRPGITLPYDDKTSHFPGGKSKHREYKPGPIVSLSGGYKWGGLMLGGGVLYKENRYDLGDSYEEVGGIRYSFDSGSKSKTVAGFVEVGYEHWLHQRVKFISNLNVGYGVSLVEDFSSSSSMPGGGSHCRERIDPTFYGSLGLGFGFAASEYFAFQLGYRYLYEDEVPAHAFEIGLVGNF